jgi:hypothetical protein
MLGMTGSASAPSNLASAQPAEEVLRPREVTLLDMPQRIGARFGPRPTTQSLLS